ncbi:MAG: CDP-diacylglycerol--glycerol-3-phosphate 3-phosphatidyltransferase [Synergistetes bacterium ADurb.Bin155]|jgi:CDP-diacylglycerol--glycerol-3-phosphate 3-phosphatidyltransferase|nr:MAG: CDP-diacylglycerol--glycerol-3-phosphate 3-phosphatidyltransferase [Synergistetes bacterium ADurb.Bin155]
MVFLTLRGQFGNILGLPFGDILAGLVFTIAALTDTFDGYFARKHGMVTNLGKIIDPLADKILVIAALISLVQLQRLPAWIVVIILSREFFVTGLRMVAASEGVVISASRGGKVKTVTQVIAILLMIFDLPGGLPAMWVALVATLWSGMEYLAKAKSLLS